MAVTSLLTPWFNPDNLAVYFPQDAGKVQRGGEVDHDSDHETQVEIDLTTLPAFNSGNQIIVHETLAIPQGAFIEEVRLLTTQAAVGATATLSIGLVANSDRSTLLSATALVNAATVASIAALGTLLKLDVGVTGAGTSVGTKLANTSPAYLIVAAPGTANFTAGKVLLRVRWSVPLAADL